MSLVFVLKGLLNWRQKVWQTELSIISEQPVFAALRCVEGCRVRSSAPTCVLEDCRVICPAICRGLKESQFLPWGLPPLQCLVWRRKSVWEKGNGGASFSRQSSPSSWASFLSYLWGHLPLFAAERESTSIHRRSWRYNKRRQRRSDFRDRTRMEYKMGTLCQRRRIGPEN